MQTLVGFFTPKNSNVKIAACACKFCTMQGLNRHDFTSRLSAARRIVVDPRLKNPPEFVNAVLKKMDTIAKEAQ